MLEVRVNFPLDDNEIERIFNALRLKHDTTHSMVFGKYYDDDFMLDEKTVGDIISRHISSECSFHSIGVDTIIESLEGNESKRNSLLKDLWENV